MIKDKALQIYNKSDKLPESWINKIFMYMQGNYGSRWISMWKTGQTLRDGRDAGMVNAMQIWAEKLSKYKNNPKVIKDALSSLPVDPPTLPMFLSMLNHYSLYKNNFFTKIEHKKTQAEIDLEREKARGELEKLKKILGRSGIKKSDG